MDLQTNLKIELWGGGGGAKILDFQKREHCDVQIVKSVAFSLLVANFEVILN